jgi:hypothetical protein
MRISAMTSLTDPSKSRETVPLPFVSQILEVLELRFLIQGGSGWIGILAQTSRKHGFRGVILILFEDNNSTSIVFSNIFDVW